MEKTFTCVIIIMLIALMGIEAGSASSINEKEVIILYKAEVTDLEITNLGIAGAKIKYVYDIIHGIAATVDEQYIDDIEADQNVELVELDYEVHIDKAPNDPRFSELWGLHNIGQTGGTSDADIDAPDSWDIQTGDSSVVIAVIDTGVDYNHEDLSANIWTNPGEIPSNGIDDEGNGYVDDVYGWDFSNNDNDPMDDHYHGTHCAGTIAAVGNNWVGVVGVNWAAKIMALKFLSASGRGYTSDAIRAIEYAIIMKQKKGIPVIAMSNSWGGGYFSIALKNAITAADNAGILFVAAAGNDGSDTDVSPHYPSSYDVPNVIAVAATDHNDALALFSNYGATSVDLAAPGVNILSTVPNNDYSFHSGTSMATPHVSGVAALIKAQAPAYTHLQIKDVILSSVDPISRLSGKMVTGGRLNSNNALQSMQSKFIVSHKDFEKFNKLVVRPLSVANFDVYDPGLFLAQANGVYFTHSVLDEFRVFDNPLAFSPVSPPNVLAPCKRDGTLEFGLTTLTFPPGTGAAGLYLVMVSGSNSAVFMESTVVAEDFQGDYRSVQVTFQGEVGEQKFIGFNSPFGIRSISFTVASRFSVDGPAFSVVAIDDISYAWHPIETCDQDGIYRDRFSPGECVYLRGGRGVFGYPLTLDIYAVTNGGLPVAVTEGIRTLPDGSLPVTLLWDAPYSRGGYDIWVDMNRNGLYDDGDLWMEEALKVYGFFVIPELPMGTLTALLSILAASTFYLARAHYNQKNQ